MTARFEHETFVSASPAVVFDLALDVDVHRASMAASNERAIAGVTIGGIGLGEEVTWRGSHFGVPFTMTSRVTELARPRRFVDQQARGPFRSFRHEHLFEAADGGTVMIDRIQFDAPLGIVGLIVERVLLGRYLRDLIAVRGQYLKAEAERRQQAGLRER